MRTIAIFILTLPLLALAILWVPIGLMFDLVALPLWLLLATVDWLKGESFDLSILYGPPLMILDMYGETTGFFSLDFI